MVLPCCHEWAPALLAPDPGRSATPTSWLRREGERSSPPLSLGSRRLPRGNAASRQVARRLELLAPPPQRPRSSEPSARDSHREQLARPADDRVVVGDRRGGRASVVPSGLPVGERLRALGDVAGTREVSVVVHDRLAVAVAVHAADVSALEHAAVRVEVPGGRGALSVFLLAAKRVAPQSITFGGRESRSREKNNSTSARDDVRLVAGEHRRIVEADRRVDVPERRKPRACVRFHRPAVRCFLHHPAVVGDVACARGG